MSVKNAESVTEDGRPLRSVSEIHYWVTGPDDGPLVVCTHGVSMNHRMFDPQVPTLTTEGYRVLTWGVCGQNEAMLSDGAFDRDQDGRILGQRETVWQLSNGERIVRCF